jgi:hypothetical protein
VNSKLAIKRTAVAAAFLAAFGASSLALAIYEVEPNAPLGSAQQLVIGSTGGVEVSAILGNPAGDLVADVDFYVFEGREGDVVTIDIDGGMKLGSSARSVDTVIAIFDQGGKKLRENDDSSVDPGSAHSFDSRIDNFRLPASARYTVGVSSWPRFLQEGGTVSSTALNGNSNGTYTLLISGVTPSAMQISVEIKPGHTGDAAPINPKSKGNIPVALLSSTDFTPLEVDQQSLRFGPEGNESSLLRCNKGDYVNADDKLDLVCHFDTQAAGFEPGDLEGIVKGSLKDGRRFEGRGLLKVVPVKRQQ